MIHCKLKARTALIEDGMSEEEALLAVEPPSLNITESADERDDVDLSDDDVNNNPFKLKKCSIRIRKLWYIEQAMELGCKSVWIPPKGSNRNSCKPKPIW